MNDLLTLARENDLPPRWDGRAVAWEAWKYAPAGVFICPPPSRADVCEGCGERTYEQGFPCWSTSRGLRADSLRLDHDDFRREEEARARLPIIAKGKMPRHWWLELIAHRCHHCNLDTVWDMTSDEWWTLDHTDYGNEGSR